MAKTKPRKKKLTVNDLKDIPIQLAIPPDFREYYATGATGNWTQYDYRINFSNGVNLMEIKQGKFASIHNNNVSVILPPKVAMETAYWLLKNVLAFEEKRGKDLKRDRLPLENIISVMEKLKKYDIKELKKELEIEKQNENERLKEQLVKIEKARK